MVQLQVTIDIPQAMINAIKEPTNANRGIRAIADAMALSTPTIVAAINNLPAQGEDNDIKIKHEEGIADKIKVEDDAGHPSRPPKRKRPNGNFNIIAKDHCGREYHLRVQGSYTTEMVMQEIQWQTGMPPDQQRLIFAGEGMRYHRTLSEYGVQDGSVLGLTYRLRGS